VGNSTYSEVPMIKHLPDTFSIQMVCGVQMH